MIRIIAADELYIARVYLQSISTLVSDRMPLQGIPGHSVTPSPGLEH
jgi:hypothetical protein